jgi:hypothetical protein
MKTASRTALFLLMTGLMLICVKPAKAQCAQCAATVATNSANGDKTANGLNNGILYLLAAPYLAIAVGGYVWYKNYRRKEVSLRIHAEKLNLN